MSSIKTAELENMTYYTLCELNYAETRDLVLRLKEAVLNQRRDLARIQRQYDEKKMQYEAVRDKLERVASGDERDLPFYVQKQVQELVDARDEAIRERDQAMRDKEAQLIRMYDLRRKNAELGAELRRARKSLAVTEVEPEQWWVVSWSPKSGMYIEPTPFKVNVLSRRGEDNLMWRNTARGKGDAERQAVAAWEQAFGVKVEL